MHEFLNLRLWRGELTWMERGVKHTTGLCLGTPDVICQKLADRVHAEHELTPGVIRGLLLKGGNFFPNLEAKRQVLVMETPAGHVRGAFGPETARRRPTLPWAVRVSWTNSRSSGDERVAGWPLWLAGRIARAAGLSDSTHVRMLMGWADDVDPGAEIQKLRFLPRDPAGLVDVLIDKTGTVPVRRVRVEER